MYVIGTSGHVDHGKSTLIQALTGIDPDRLREEKTRGMTIELGFAWLELPSGIEVSVVDVPGHERFIKNMLMGTGGVDVALLIVAADEGVMPQTREHLAILDLLGITDGLVVITKKDLVDPDWLDLAIMDVQESLRGTSLQDAEIISVSAEANEGLEKLIASLDRIISRLGPHENNGNPRLPVDRSFTISGFGAVVTGTLTDGVLKTGEEIEILPSGRRARIRSLQVHETSQDQVEPGTRAAVNLSGIDHTDIARGDLITHPDWLVPSNAFDATFSTIRDAPRTVHHNHKVTLYAGTRELPATVRVLEGERILPGNTGWVQIRTQTPVPVARGDFFVVRDSQNTLGGGKVLEPTAPRRKRNDQPTIQRLEILATGSIEEISFNALRDIEPATLRQLSEKTGAGTVQIEESVRKLETERRLQRIGNQLGFVCSTVWWESMTDSAITTLLNFHNLHPLRQGMPLQVLRDQLNLASPPFGAVTQSLAAEKKITTDDATVRLPSHRPELTEKQRTVVSEYLTLLGEDRFSPSTEHPIDIEILQFLIERGDVVRISDDIVYPADAYAEIESKILESGQDDQQITITSVRDIFGTSRKYTLAILEYMDSKNLTRRTGDNRFLR